MRVRMHVRMCVHMLHAVRYLRRNERMRQCGRARGADFDLPLVASRSDSLTDVRRRRGAEGEGGVALLQTPAVFEQHTTSCLKISRVESTSTGGSHVCPPHTRLFSMMHAAAPCCFPTPMPCLATRIEMVPRCSCVGLAGTNIGEQEGRGRSSGNSPCLIVARCRSCEALGSEKEIT